MTLIGDLHIHTFASPGAFNTIWEMAHAAEMKGLSIIAITDHGPGMKYGGANPIHFKVLKMVPKKICNVRILRGIESNIMDGCGNLDIPMEDIDNLDFIIAGFHEYAWLGGSKKENTDAAISVMKNPLVHMISHIENPAFPVDLEAVVFAAKQTGTIIEINNSSLSGSGTRAGSFSNCLSVAKLCKKYSVTIAVNSDAHIFSSVGVFDEALKLLEQAGIGDEQVINTSEEKILSFLGIR